MASLLVVKDLVKHFPLPGSKKVVTAVNGISFECNQSKTLGLIGESGCGKTTAARCILKLIEPTGGEVFFHDQKISSMKPKEFRSLRTNMQLVFQEPFDSLNPLMSADSIIAEPVKLWYRLKGGDLKSRVIELASLVGLDKEDLGRRPAQLSGGQQQRVGIARALASNPEFIVLDEPISNLDPSAQGDILELLIELRNRLRLSYLFISHDLSTVRDICDDVAVMYLGKIVEIGPVKDVFNSTYHPYSRALLSSVLYPDPWVKRERFVLKGEVPSPVDLPQGCYLYSRCPIAVDECKETPPYSTEVGYHHFVACTQVKTPISSQESDKESSKVG